MNRRAYFLACLQVHLLRMGPYEPRARVVEIQSRAWRLPEEAIPEDPAEAAFEFFGYYAPSLLPEYAKIKPEWLEAWEETKEKR